MLINQVIRVDRTESRTANVTFSIGNRVMIRYSTAGSEPMDLGSVKVDELRVQLAGLLAVLDKLAEVRKDELRLQVAALNAALDKRAEIAGE